MTSGMSVLEVILKYKYSNKAYGHFAKSGHFAPLSPSFSCYSSVYMCRSYIFSAYMCRSYTFSAYMCRSYTFSAYMCRSYNVAIHSCYFSPYMCRSYILHLLTSDWRELKFNSSNVTSCEVFVVAYIIHNLSCYFPACVDHAPLVVWKIAICLALPYLMWLDWF